LIQSANLNAALALVEAGLHVFPCKPDKTPMLKNWEQSAIGNALAVTARWSGASEAIPAIPVGAHGIVVIDCDRKKPGADGVANFYALCSEHRIDLSNAFIVETPSGGLHFYWLTAIPYSNSRGSLPSGIDVRGLGGYVIAPGATLPDGRTYKVITGTWDAIPHLPEALAAFVREKNPATTLVASGGPVGYAVTDRERAFAQAALATEVTKLTSMQEGSGRNAALNLAAHSLATMNGWIGLDAVFVALFDAAIANGYVSKDGEAAAKQTIASGINAGMKKPRPLLAESVPDIDIGMMINNGIAKYKAKHSSKPANSHAKRSVALLQGTQIEEKPITWLWDGYLPSGKLTLLAGAGGTGKSTIAFNIAGTITNGGTWPDGTRCCVAGNVLIWSSEDDPADTIKPRLMAVGANPRRYGVIVGAVDESGLRCPFDAARDVEGLRDAVSQIGGISLLIIDPIITAVTGDMHKANDVRRSLQAIVDFAAEMSCAVLGITHFAKGTAGKNSAERVIGSQAFAALARMVLVAAKEEESDRRVFTRAKSNNSIDTGGFSYGIEALTLQRGIVATRVVWGEALEGSSRSILAQVEGEGEHPPINQQEHAKRFLVEQLKAGPVRARDVVDAAITVGLTERTLQRAKEKLGITATKSGYQGAWVWSFPN
jgi:hypothetical protein